MFPLDQTWLYMKLKGSCTHMYTDKKNLLFELSLVGGSDVKPEVAAIQVYVTRACV